MPFSRVLGSSIAPDGYHAFVLLGTNEPPVLYPYLVECFKERDGWLEGSGSNGNMWMPTSENGNAGGIAVWDEAPNGAETVTVQFQDEQHHVPVRDGYYLFVAWGVAADSLGQAVLVT